jgi:hypothetical protein
LLLRAVAVAVDGMLRSHILPVLAVAVLVDY